MASFDMSDCITELCYTQANRYKHEDSILIPGVKKDWTAYRNNANENKTK